MRWTVRWIWGALLVVCRSRKRNGSGRARLTRTSKVCKERTIYYWTGDGVRAVSRYTSALIKLVPTEWGPPTFEIDGIKMLPTGNGVAVCGCRAQGRSWFSRAAKRVLDTCGGLGYFAAWCLQGAGRARCCRSRRTRTCIWLREPEPVVARGRTRR